MAAERKTVRPAGDKTGTKNTIKAAAKPAPAPATRRKAAAAPNDGAPPRRTRKATAQPIPAELRLQYIREAAYYIAERRGFAEGDPQEDWAQAEQQVDRLLLGR